MLACAVTAAGLHYVVGWPWMAAVLLGLLISATDPVSVVATFKEAGVTGRLRLLVEAESLLNDGTVGGALRVALAALAGESVRAGGIAGGNSVGHCRGGPALWTARRRCRAAARWKHGGPSRGNHFHDGGGLRLFFLAERLGLSGVMATLAAGVLIGNTGVLGAFTDRGREAVASFWEYAGFVANSLIFC